ncbi:hypothetical protein PoB_003883300 [Plakobranchus ocellatus]|uniref:Uncharacterized protein n=1 Tax=Plakobranchus ocellatus TaxID=259542 RepID=A0AAV4B0S0_9GAST|nr:hypothetical protein PoB_003883300 [Plakobranchus ocellatus]
MADMIISIAFLVSASTENVCPVTKGRDTTGTSRTSWTGLSIEILNLLSKALSFTSLPFAVTDGGIYGLYEADGDAFGLVGKYKHRLLSQRIEGSIVNPRRCLQQGCL